MDSPSERAEVAQLLAEARRSGGSGLGSVLELYRHYLLLVARAQMSVNLRKVANPSDLVQETFLEACRDFGQFEGTTETQWRAWLRRILAHNLATLVETHVQARKRDVRRQVSLDQEFVMAGSSALGQRAAAVCCLSSPSSQARQHEASAVLTDRLAQLPPAYQEVLRLRNFEGLTFDEVARRMGRTPGAVRVLWVRALDQLRLLMKEEDLI